MDQLLEQARHEATHEIATGIITAISEGIDRHGDDPDLPVIIGAALVHAIKEIERNVIPGFVMLVQRSLLTTE